MRLHEGVRDYSHRSFSPGFLHQFHEAVIILGSIEQHTLSRTSVEYVIHESARRYASGSGHDAFVPGKRIASAGRAVATADRGQTPTRRKEVRIGV